VRFRIFSPPPFKSHQVFSLRFPNTYNQNIFQIHSRSLLLNGYHEPFSSNIASIPQPALTAVYHLHTWIMANSTIIPLEVLTLICTHFPRADLKQARLVSRAWNPAAESSLFRNIFLQINIPSFERLQDIPENDHLRKHVKIIHYDVQRISSLPYTFSEWREFEAAHGLNMSPPTRRNFLSQFSEDQLEEYYFAYCSLLSGQEHISKRGLQKTLLTKAIKSFPGSLGAEFVAGPEEVNYCPYGKNEPELSSLDLIRRSVLVRPHCSPNAEVKKSINAFGKAALSHRMKRFSG
jgi:hypothetical protein